MFLNLSHNIALLLSKIESNTHPHRARSERARRYEEGVGESLSLRVGRARAQGVEVDELRAEGEDGLVEHVVELDDGPQARALRQAELARDVEVECEEARPASGVARQIAGLPYERKPEGFDEARVERIAGPTKAEQTGVARESGPVVAHVVEIAVNAARAQVEGSAGRDAHNRRQA